MKPTKPTLLQTIKALLFAIIIMFVAVSMLFCFAFLINKAIAVNFITETQQIENNKLLEEWKECLINNVKTENDNENCGGKIKKERIVKIKKYDFIDFNSNVRNEFKKTKKC